jgi:hypothetical protein
MPSKYGFPTPEEEHQKQLEDERRRRRIEEEQRAKEEARRQELERVQRVASEISRDFEQTTGTTSAILGITGRHGEDGKLYLEVEYDYKWYEEAGPQRSSKLSQIRTAFKNALGLTSEYDVSVWNKDTREALARARKKEEDETWSRRHSSSDYTWPGDDGRQGHGL